MDRSERGAFAETLRRLRTRAGLTQQELAERSGVSIRSVSDLERAINERPHRETAVMLAAGLALKGEKRTAFLDVARARPRSRRMAARSSGYPPLPEPTGQLLGRERELQAIKDALHAGGIRLLTLTGPGGVGKTRLAMAAAHEVADRFADGVLFVRLDGLSDPALVLPTLAGALRLLETGGQLPLGDRLARHLAGRQLLIVLDNLEHLLPAAANLADLLHHAPRVAMLVTSRESLRVRGEHVIAVTPLPRPDPATWQAPEPALDGETSPAIALFFQRARAASPNVAGDRTTPEGRATLAFVAQICHRLDGLPLAIELAAAQAQVLSPAAILALLTNAGLPLLAGGGRDQPARLQTMDAAIAWSYNLLPADEQALFRALSVFAGGFTLPAAAAVTGLAGLAATDPFDPRRPLANLDPALIGVISSLARKNLLFEDTEVSGDTAPRFRMLEPIRLFALERLREAGQEPAARLRHANVFVRLAEALDTLTLGPNPEIWLRQQVIELDNIRAAQDWALAAGEHDLVVRMTCAIAQLWELRGLLSEARQRVSRALTVDAHSSPTTRWFLRFWAGTFALDRGDVAGATAYARELLEIAAAHDEPVGTGVGHALLSRATGASPDGHKEAAELARRAVDTLEPLGHDEWTGLAWTRLGIEQHMLGRLEESRASLLRGLEVRQRKPCEGCIAYSLVSIGAVSIALGDPIAALDAYRECLELTVKQENQTLMLSVLLGLADAACQYGAEPAPERTALRFFGAAEGLRKRHGLGGTRAAREAIVDWQAPMRQSLGHGAVDALIGEGMDMSLDDAVALAQGLHVDERRSPMAARDGAVSLFAAFGSVE